MVTRPFSPAHEGSRDACRSRCGRRVRVSAARSPAPARAEADPVRRRRAQLHRQAVGVVRRPLGADVPGRLRGRPAQPGRHDPLRGAERAGGRPRRAHVQRVAGPGGADAGARGPAVHRRQSPPGGRVRRLRPELLHRTRLHEHAHGPGPRGHPAGVEGPDARRPDRAGRRPRGLQPRADRRLHRRGDHRRRRAGRARHDEDHPRLEGGGPPGRPRGGPLPPREDGLGLRPGLLRRRVPARPPHRASRTEQERCPVAGVEAHRHGPRRMAVPEAAAGPARRDGP